MAHYIINAAVFRFALPFLLIVSIIFRPCVLSGIYLLFLLYSPLVPIPSSQTLNGHTGIYLKILLVISILIGISQFAFQIVLFSMPPYGDFLKNCEQLEQILRHVGYVRLNGISITSAITWITPEVVMTIGSVVVYLVCSKMVAENDGTEGGRVSTRGISNKPNKRASNILVSIGKYVTLTSICISAILRPSVQGGLYFLVFLSSATWWSLYKELRRGFAIVLRCLMVVVFCNIVALFVIQMQWPQELMKDYTNYMRYFGLTELMTVDCSDPREFLWTNSEWASYLNPLMLIWLYYMLAIESKELIKSRVVKKSGAFSLLENPKNGTLERHKSQRLSNRRLIRSATTRNRWQTATRKARVLSEHGSTGETTPLISGVSPSKKYGSGKKTSTILQDSTGSVTVVEEMQDDIPMEPLGEGPADEEEEKPTWIDNMFYVLESLLQIIIKSSYIATNIIMMTWSITFHSWITFVLLLWANILWMVPNQRRVMFRCSPFLVIYAWFLLIAAYVYSMNLTDEELPRTIDGVDLVYIGFEKILVLPCKALAVKCLFTSMFWITLRQYMQERAESRQTSALSDMVAPLQVTVGAAAGVPDETEKGNKVMQKIGDYTKNFLTKFWIWIVAITLFSVAITGERMTCFRIIYMALFLFFIISFQFSFTFWRKMMLVFWFTVILYSMVVLILTYTYQFKNIRESWTNDLHISEALQLDIGLEDFGTKQLFIRLVTPTFFVIITAIQIHYFHSDFMKISDPKSLTITEPFSEGSSAQGGIIEPTSEKTDLESSLKYDLTDIGNISTAQLQETFNEILKLMQHIANLFFIFMEIHLPKLVLCLAMLLCIYDKCAIYLVVIILLVLSFLFGRPVYMFAIYSCSLLVALMVLARMIYQIEYFTHENWNVSCSNIDTNVTINDTIQNNAEWLGFKKSNKVETVPVLLQWNIYFLLGVTLWTVVLVRQFNYRVARGQPTNRAYFMFPKIKRSDADKNVKNCLKYLSNYGFYKFGVEICLIATAALIGIRMDMYAMFYSFWLCILFCCNRTYLSKLWPIYFLFIAIILPVQYAMLIGLPPSLCIEFPWDSSPIMRRLRNWAYLINANYSLPNQKLLCDFVVLLFVSRQMLVFRIENHHENREYPGGSNKSIIHHAEEKDFVNPVPDFITYCRSYLDVFKRTIFLSWLWISLAAIFLAGTNRVNIFSIGYLVGSFVFLWQGSEFYLRPIPKILRSWNWLLGYNVAVIIIKTVLQLAGCVYIDALKQHACWLVHLLAIGCINQNVADTDKCNVSKEYIGLVWDIICFAFLLMQRRIFKSYNFFHMVNETKATTILASRGADLIEELTQKRLKEQEDGERLVLEKIKAKMDRIKASQQKIHGPKYEDTTNHFVAQPPLARSTSMSSCTSATSEQTPPAGYHTPIDEEELAPLTPHTGSILHTQVPSPFSAIMTVSLEGYLEPQRISFSSPPNSELNPRPPSPDDSFPVFSPPPYEAAPAYTAAVSEVPSMPVQRQSSIGPPWMQGSLITPRQSIISYSSRSPLSHHTYGIYSSSSRPRYRKHTPKTYKEAIRSGDYYMFDELDDDDDLELIEETSPGQDLEEEEPPRERRLTLGELLSTTMKTDIKTTIRSTEGDVHRRSSIPLARQRSILSARSQISVPYSAPPAVGTRPYSVVIIDPKDQIQAVDEIDQDPQPGTSKDEDISELSEPEEDTWYQKVMNYLIFAWVFLESVMVSGIIFLNKYSREYRYILRVLNKEKKLLKEKTNYSIGLRLGTGQMWQPAGSYHTLLKEARAHRKIRSTETSEEKAPLSEEEDFGDTVPSSSLPNSPEYLRRKASVLTVPEIRILAPSLERGLDSPFAASHTASPTMFYDEYDAEMSSVDQPTIIRLLLAMWYIVLSHSEILCYFVIFLDQIKSATFLSLPLPLMVFLWGTLSIPRPTKTFWVTIIAYTEIIVLIKCMFQFENLLWNRSQIISPFYPPRIIGIEKKNFYALWDLLVLLIVFFHRFLLKCLGLWKSTYIPAAMLTDGDYQIKDGTLISTQQDVRKRSPPIRSHRIYSHRLLFQHTISIYYPYRLRYKRDMYRTSKFLTAYINTLLKQIQSTAVTATTTGAINTFELASSEQKMVPDSETSAATDLPKDATDSLNSGEKVISIRTEKVHPFSNFKAAFTLAVKRYGSSVKIFFEQLLDPTSRIAADVYSYMFLCDFFNFFVLLIGYSSFGGAQQGDEGVQTYLEDNRVPVLFLLMLILQFALIIIDRAIFLRKYIFGKVVFQFIQIIMLHVWLFILYPIITDRGFNSVIPPQMYYMVKCFYLLLSAYQIRCGYPTRILGNFICKGYNYLNMFLFKAFMAIPFLFELRTVMDWMWTDTSMTVFDWIKMEDIFAHIFQLKCTRHVESEYPQPRGERKSPIIKYLMGGIALIVMIAIIWFPLVFFALGNAVGTANVPYDVTMDVRIGPYEPIYRMSVQSNSIFSFDNSDMNKLLRTYDDNKAALTFINNYEASDIAAVKFSNDSATVWTISPPDRQRMIEEINSTKPLNIHLQYIVSHKSNTKEDSGIIREDVELTLAPFLNAEQNPIRTQLYEMLLNSSPSPPPVPLMHLFPKFIKVTNKGSAKAVSALMNKETDIKDKKYRNIKINRQLMTAPGEPAVEEWWEIHEDCQDANYVDYLQFIPYFDECHSLIMYTFNDKIFPSQLNFIAAGGIIGVYTTIVLVAGRLLRGVFAGMCFQIMFEDMPNVDRVLQLCYDVYLVREVNEFSLEEDLFAKLVFLFRSPETLIKWTRPKDEINDDDDDDEDIEDDDNSRPNQIVGMYMLYFFVAFRFTRMVLIGPLFENIWYLDMPNCDRIYALINDIYLVRAMRLYNLEEDLFAKLVFILRSRELSIKLTRLSNNSSYNPNFIIKKETSNNKEKKVTEMKK